MHTQDAGYRVYLGYEILLRRAVEVILYGIDYSHIYYKKRQHDNAEIVEYPALCDTLFSHYCISFHL